MRLRSSRRLALIFALTLGTALQSFAQAITISPSAVYLDSRHRSLAVTAFNPAATPTEVTINFQYGYPQSDSDGKISVPLTSEASAGEPSAVAWMRAFPRRFVLAAGQRQVFRVLAEPPANLADGEYWARLVIACRGVEEPVEEKTSEASVVLHVRTTLITAANYRQGNVTTGVDVVRAAARRSDARVAVDVDLARTGNAAFLGRITAVVLDERKAIVGKTFEDLAVYRSMNRHLWIDLPAGTVPSEVRLTIEARRDDIPPEAIRAAPAVTRTIRLEP